MLTKRKLLKQVRGFCVIKRKTVFIPEHDLYKLTSEQKQCVLTLIKEYNYSLQYTFSLEHGTEIQHGFTLKNSYEITDRGLARLLQEVGVLTTSK